MNIGIILGVSPQHLILRAQEWEPEKEIPEIGAQVYDAQKVCIGRIADIFGPVKKPFISITLDKRAGFTLEQFQEKKGQSFYTIPSKKKNPKSAQTKHRNFPREHQNKTGPKMRAHQHSSFSKSPSPKK